MFPSLPLAVKTKTVWIMKFQVALAIEICLTYFQMNVMILQFTLRYQRCFHRTKLCAFWDASLGEHPTQEAIDVEYQRQTGPGL